MIKVLKHALSAIGYLLYGLYAWAAFTVVILFVVLFATILPGLDRRRRWVSGSARVLLRIVGIPTIVTGLEHLPDGHCIVVVNHSSHVDGVVLQASLPPRFSFVIKGEVRKVPILHFLLRRVGSIFVERFVAAGSSRDARNLVKAATDGESMVIFPEGTFIAEAGLSRFRPGAFAAAIKGELPVVPVAIRGSRNILRAWTFWPRRGSLQVDILHPIATSGSAFANSAELADVARSQMLEVLDEPDLMLSDSPSQRSESRQTKPVP
jgi:1-acyl-sn-glycerol-3-phosphate acyltransferase